MVENYIEAKMCIYTKDNREYYITEIFSSDDKVPRNIQTLSEQIYMKIRFIADKGCFVERPEHTDGGTYIGKGARFIPAREILFVDHTVNSVVVDGNEVGKEELENYGEHVYEQLKQFDKVKL